MKKILFFILFLTGCSTSQNLVENYHQEYKLYIDEDNEFQEYVNDEIKNMPYSERQKLDFWDISAIYDLFNHATMTKEKIYELKNKISNDKSSLKWKEGYIANIYINENEIKTFSNEWESTFTKASSSNKINSNENTQLVSTKNVSTEIDLKGIDIDEIGEWTSYSAKTWRDYAKLSRYANDKKLSGKFIISFKLGEIK